MSLLSENPERKYTAREIAERVLKKYPKECKEKLERSKATAFPLNDEKALLQQIVAEIGASRQFLAKRYPAFRTIEERPRKYYYTDDTDQEEIDANESEHIRDPASASEPTRLQEHDLYPLLRKFLRTEGPIYSMRINEKRSSNKRGANGNKWLYPDLVAMEDLTDGWDSVVKTCATKCSAKKIKIWSFEVKSLINRSNVRESFFQAVSNSSWANCGYLVAAELGGSADKELRILSSLHGIGFILLNTKNLEESQTIIPARERAEVDWDTANRLVEENPNFSQFIKKITRFYQTGEVNPRDWDIVED